MHYRTAPAARTASAARVRCRVLYMSTGIVLTVFYIAHPFAIESLRVQCEHCALAYQLPVAGISAPLQMRTIGGDSGMHVA